MSSSSAENADGKAAGGPVISLRRIGASARKLTAEPERRHDRPEPRAGGVPAEPSDPRPRDGVQAPRQDRGAGSLTGHAVPAVAPPVKSDNLAAARAPLLGSAIERVTERAEKALAGRTAGVAPEGAVSINGSVPVIPSPELSRPPIAASHGAGDGGARPLLASERLKPMVPTFTPWTQMDRTGSRTDDANADPDWVLEVIGQALADQARREGIDLT